MHTPAIRESLRLPYGGEESNDQDQRTLEYGRYSDNDDRGSSRDEEVEQEVTRLNSQSRLASLVEGSRVQPSGLMHSGLNNDANKVWAAHPGD